MITKTKMNLYTFFFNYEIGALIEFDTFRGNSVNGGKVYYNWSPNKLETNGCTSSGGFIYDKEESRIALINNQGEFYKIPNYPVISWEKGETDEEYRKRVEPIEIEQDRLKKEGMDAGYKMIWVGDHDCREAIVTNLKRLQEYGELLKYWIKPPSCLWLTTFMDWENKVDPNEITKQRIEKLPQQVRKQIKL